MSDKKTLQILDLCSKPNDALAALLGRLSCEVVRREKVENYESLDFVIVDGEEEAKAAQRDFACAQNDVVVICVGPVKEVRGFLLGNGRMNVDPEFIGTALGQAVLENFFTAQRSIHLGEAYSGQFSETDSFKVVNHLSLGLSADELSLAAFEKGFNIVALRSFLDHILIYLTYLKQAGLAGIPFEIEYSSNDELFAVNIHAPVKNFAAEYLLDSFGAVNSKDPIQYLLGVAARSTDYLDISYVEDPARIVFGAFWGRSNTKSGGLGFNNIKTTAQIAAGLERKIRAYKPGQEREEAAAAKAQELKTKSLPGGILAMALNSSEGSFFIREPEFASGLIAFIIGRFEERHPDQSLNEMELADLVKILGEHSNADAVSKLSGKDHEDILEKIHKKHITDAYNEELQRARERLKDDEDFTKDLSDNFSNEVVKRVSGHLDAEVLNRILGQKEEEDAAIRIGGQEDVDNFKAVVKGIKEKHKGEFSQKISGSFESKAGEFRVSVSGSGEDSKKGLFNFVSSALSGVEDLNLDKRAKSFFLRSAPARISAGLEKYASRIGLDIATLEESHLIDFKNTELPLIIEDTLSDEPSIEEFVKGLETSFDRSDAVLNNGSPEFREKFKRKLESRLGEIEGLEVQDGRYVFTDEKVEEEAAQAIIQSAMREALSEDFSFNEGSKEEIDAKEQLAIQELSKTLKKDSEEVAKIIKGASEDTKEKEAQKVVANLFAEKPGEKEDVVLEEYKQSEEEIAKARSKEQGSSNSSLEEAHLLKRLKGIEDENKKLRDALKAMEINKEAQKSGVEALERIDKIAQKEVSEELAKGNSKSELGQVVVDLEQALDGLDKGAITALREGRPIDKDEAEKIAQAIEREQQLLTSAREAQDNIRKLEIEIQKKESLFLAEVKKANKSLKAKDLVVQKAKDSMQLLVEKKQSEIRDAKKHIEELNQRLNDDQSTKLLSQVKALKKECESTAKIAEMYKSKVEGMLKKKTRNNQNSQAEQMASENRTLSRLNVQLENKLNSELREKKSFENQYNKLKAQEGKLRARANGAESQVKKLQEECEKFKANEARLVALANKKEGGGSDPKLLKELEMLKATNAQLQATMKDMADKGRGGGAQSQAAASSVPASTKEKHLEQSVKKLNGELSKARNEVSDAKKAMQKMKAETVALKNKIKMLEKNQGGKKKAA